MANSIDTIREHYQQQIDALGSDTGDVGQNRRRNHLERMLSEFDAFLSSDDCKNLWGGPEGILPLIEHGGNGAIERLLTLVARADNEKLLVCFHGDKKQLIDQLKVTLRVTEWGDAYNAFNRINNGEDAFANALVRYFTLAKEFGSAMPRACEALRGKTSGFSEERYEALKKIHANLDLFNTPNDAMQFYPLSPNGNRETDYIRKILENNEDFLTLPPMAQPLIANRLQWDHHQASIAKNYAIFGGNVAEATDTLARVVHGEYALRRLFNKPEWLRLSDTDPSPRIEAIKQHENLIPLFEGRDAYLRFMINRSDAIDLVVGSQRMVPPFDDMQEAFGFLLALNKTDKPLVPYPQKILTPEFLELTNSLTKTKLLEGTKKENLKYVLEKDLRKEMSLDYMQAAARVAQQLQLTTLDEGIAELKRVEPLKEHGYGRLYKEFVGELDLNFLKKCASSFEGGYDALIDSLEEHRLTQLPPFIIEYHELGGKHAETFWNRFKNQASSRHLRDVSSLLTEELAAAAALRDVIPTIDTALELRKSDNNQAMLAKLNARQKADIKEMLKATPELSSHDAVQLIQLYISLEDTTVLKTLWLKHGTRGFPEINACLQWMSIAKISIEAINQPYEKLVHACFDFMPNETMAMTHRHLGQSTGAPRRVQGETDLLMRQLLTACADSHDIKEGLKVALRVAENASTSDQQKILYATDAKEFPQSFRIAFTKHGSHGVTEILELLSAFNHGDLPISAIDEPYEDLVYAVANAQIDRITKPCAAHFQKLRDKEPSSEHTPFGEGGAAAWLESKPQAWRVIALHLIEGSQSTRLAEFIAEVDASYTKGMREFVRAHDLNNSNPTKKKALFHVLHGENAKLGMEELKRLSFAIEDPKLIPEIPTRAFREAYRFLLNNTPESGHEEGWEAKAALGLAFVFGNNWKSWLNRMQRDGVTLHDACYWLPQIAHEASARIQKRADEVVPAGSPPKIIKKAPSLSEWLESNYFSSTTREEGAVEDRKTVRQRTLRPLAELETIGKRWAYFSEEQKNLPYKDMLALARSMVYGGCKSQEFATEAAHWGVSEANYPAYEHLYLSGQANTVPFDTEQRFKSGELVGRFLPRSDPRVGFFGQHTDCCQHLDHGTGKSCAVSTMADPFSQLFVIENGEGRIIAGSWAWEAVNDGYKTACFDNIEHRLGEKQKAAVQAIYQQAGNAVAEAGYKKVTIGKGQSDLDLSAWPATAPLHLPEKYSGYSDARTQVLLAKNENALPTSAIGKDVWVRGALQHDLDTARTIAQQCYPSGLQHVSLPNDQHHTKGIVLMHKERGTIGYAVWDEHARHITDIAVLPDERRYSARLFHALIAHIREAGGEWSAEARNDTTYQLLKAYEKHGRITLHDDGAAYQHAGETYHSVRFSAVDRPAEHAPQGIDNGTVTDLSSPSRGRRTAS